MRTTRIVFAGRLTVAMVSASAIAVVLFGLSGCGNKRAENPTGTSQTGDNVPRVQTFTVKQQNLLQKIELPGTVEGIETADLYAKVGGYLQEFATHPETQKPIDIGDRVEKDQVLARLWIPEMPKELAEKEAAAASARANVEQARASLAEANTQLQEKQYRLALRESEYNRTKGLVERGSINAQLLDEAKFQRDAARAAVDSVQARIRTAAATLQSAEAKVVLAEAERDKVQTMLEYGEIRAPFDGVVTNRYVDRGAFIQPAEGNSAAKPLLTVTRLDVVRVFVDLPMDVVRWLNRGDKAVLDRISVLPGKRFPGEVARFSTSLHKTSRMMRVEIDLENPDQKLLPGYFGYVTLSLDEFSQTPVVPSSALMAEEGQLFVYVVEGELCRKRSITPNYQDGAIVGVGSGLQGGEQVVEAGAGQLEDGQRVIAVNGEKGI